MIRSIPGFEYMRFVVTISFVLLASVVWSQARNQPTSRDPEWYEVSPGAGKSVKKSKKELRLERKLARKKERKDPYRKAKSGYTVAYEAKLKEYDQRLKEASKAYKKEQKLNKKPQNSDPTFFGHKKKPKKRRVGKRKLCRECGIVH